MVGPQSEPAAVLYSTNPDTAAEQVIHQTFRGYRLC